jgi:hypothetical protein
LSRVTSASTTVVLGSAGVGWSTAATMGATRSPPNSLGFGFASEAVGERAREGRVTRCHRVVWIGPGGLSRWA